MSAVLHGVEVVSRDEDSKYEYLGLAFLEEVSENEEAGSTSEEKQVC